MTQQSNTATMVAAATESKKGTQKTSPSNSPKVVTRQSVQQAAKKETSAANVQSTKGTRKSTAGTSKSPSAKKKEKPPSFTTYMDQVIRAGGTYDEMVEKLKKLAEKHGSKLSITRGLITAHVKYRQRQKSVTDYLGGKKMTKDGIF